MCYISQHIVYTTLCQVMHIYQMRQEQYTRWQMSRIVMIDLFAEMRTVKWLWSDWQKKSISTHLCTGWPVWSRRFWIASLAVVIYSQGVFLILFLFCLLFVAFLFLTEKSRTNGKTCDLFIYFCDQTVFFLKRIYLSLILYVLTMFWSHFGALLIV